MLAKITPLDTVFFRDGKPFSWGEETWAEGIFPPYSWPPMTEIIDQHVIYIPMDIEKGLYTVSLKLDIKTQYPNYSIRDIFSDKDKYSGTTVNEIIIE